MVLPDGTKSDRSRPGKGRAFLFAVAALAIVAGFVALGSLSPSDPVATETTTTTITIPEVEAPIDPENFSLSQIATGPPLEWRRVAESTTGYPLAVTQHEGTFYLFASDHPPWGYESGGLSTWRSSNGEDWEAHGAVIDREYKVSRLKATSHGFVAAGLRPGDSNLIVWWSDDAMEWTATTIPAGADSGYLMPRPTAMAMLDQRAVVVANHGLDSEGLLEDRLAAAGIEVEMSRLRWDTRYGGEDGIELNLLGPFGMTVLTTNIETLDLSEQEHEWLMSGATRDGDSSIWIVDPRGNWESGTIPLNQVTYLASRPDGTLIANGLGGAGISDAMVSNDGLRWDPPEDDILDRSAIISWGDRLISFSADLRPEVSISSDGRNWDETGLMRMFPPQVGRWYPGAMGASSEGLALTVEGQNTSGFTSSGEPTVTLTSNDANLTLSPQRGELILETDGETHAWPIPRPGLAEPTEGLEPDLANGTLRFLEPDTGQTLAEFSFEELYRAETRTRTVRFSDIVAHHALAFTRDGESWDIRDIGTLVKDDSRVQHLGVGQRQLIAILEKPSFGPDGVQSTGFEIWTAPLP